MAARQQWTRLHNRWAISALAGGQLPVDVRFREQSRHRQSYSVLLRCMSDGALNACLSFGSLKYRHHFGLDCFSVPGEHWTLQASLTHSIKDEVFAPSFASGFDASALAGISLARTGLVGGKICSVGATSLIGFSSTFPQSAHPARARARGAANSHFIFAPMMQGQRHPCIMRSLEAPKE